MEATPLALYEYYVREFHKHKCDTVVEHVGKKKWGRKYLRRVFPAKDYEYLVIGHKAAEPVVVGLADRWEAERGTFVIYVAEYNYEAGTLSLEKYCAKQLGLFVGRSKVPLLLKYLQFLYPSIAAVKVYKAAMKIVGWTSYWAWELDFPFSDVTEEDNDIIGGDYNEK